ncbi:MAG TPA: histidine phosphatase family protein [Acidimicrobiales bacterium]|jgi:glucosyl-3-phosphoglycerate phosphatase|nr:histidine phosphatase family protein [Acidimicrobiales bacterium]
MARLLLLRHGRSTWNADGRWQGWADAPLAPGGEEQARALGAMLAGAGVTFAGAVSSDLARSVATAAIVAAVLGLGEVEVEPDLRERDVGDWTGRTTEEIELIWPGAVEAWRAGRLDRPPGGEHEPSFRARVVGAVERLAARPGGPLLVVTHGGVIRAVERHLGGDPRSTANLSGRWAEVVDGALAAGEAVALPVDEEEAVTTAL